MIMDMKYRFEQCESQSGFQEIHTQSEKTKKPLYRQGEEKRQQQNLSAWIYLLLIRMQSVMRHTL